MRVRAGARPRGRGGHPRLPEGRRAGRVAVAGVVCALTVVLLPPAQSGASTAGGGPGPSAAPDAGRVPEQPQGESRRPVTVPGQPGGATAECEDPEASLRPSDVSGPAVRRIKDRAYLIAGVDQNSFRWGYRNPATGDLAGFDIDLVRAIAQDILGPGGKVVFRTIPTNQRIPALQQRKVDIVVRTMTVNCDRIKRVAFSTAYFQAGQQVLVPQGSSVTGYNSTLHGKRVCTADGSTGEAELRQASHGARVTTVPNQLDCLVRLQLGEVDAVVTDNALAAGQAAQDPSVRLVGEPFTREPYGVAMHRADEDLVRRVNRVLEDYRRGGDDSLWTQAYEKWLAADLKGISGPPEPKYTSD
ncbi:glutamate ABC transporter substrate-binding protein [Streptomyces sp. KR80]|uniref:glutamate ABC transporter substrate-binding protein n=1 Tax=Streptomyces sp. KR80 TaxID=3457426 RepID=UPI003FD214A2